MGLGQMNLQWKWYSIITGDAQAGQTISTLTEQNAFCKAALPDGITYRFSSHDEGGCAEHSFLVLRQKHRSFIGRRFWPVV